jgi:hypothetical protein
VAIDVATLLFSVHGRDAAPKPVLARLAAYAVDRDGVAVTTVCLASALFDRCVFATSGWEAAVVTAYLLRAASLFEHLADKDCSAHRLARERHRAIRFETADCRNFLSVWCQALQVSVRLCAVVHA